MSEQDQIELIDEAFAGFRANVAPSVSGVNTDAVHNTVTRRHRARTAAFSVLAILAIAVPIAVYSAVTNGDQGPPPIPAESGTPTAPATSTPSPSATPSAGQGPDGRVTAQQLTEGPRDIPAWGSGMSLCPSGSTPLFLTGDYNLVVGDVIHTNLDGDGALETAAMIGCNSGPGTSEGGQIVAFDRDAKGGIVTLGQILAPDRNANVIEVVARPRGGITADIGSIVGNDRQVKEFAWDGQKISQVSPGSMTAGFLDDSNFSGVSVTVPSWGPGLENCQSGQIQLNAGSGIGTWGFRHFNNDSDDDFETAVLIHCRETVAQLVVYDRDQAGKIVLVGQVSFEGPNRSQRILQDFHASSSGRSLIVAMSPPGGNPTNKQNREYSWDGSKFIQVSGPTSF